MASAGPVEAKESKEPEEANEIIPPLQFNDEVTQLMMESERIASTIDTKKQKFNEIQEVVRSHNQLAGQIERKINFLQSKAVAITKDGKEYVKANKHKLGAIRVFDISTSRHDGDHSLWLAMFDQNVIYQFEKDKIITHLNTSWLSEWDDNRFNNLLMQIVPIADLGM